MITTAEIRAVVAPLWGLRADDLLKRSRKEAVAHPRQVAMSLSRELTRHSLTSIAGFFGGYDHTTVMHAIRAVEKRAAVDPDYARKVMTARTRLETGQRLAQNELEAA